MYKTICSLIFLSGVFSSVAQTSIDEVLIEIKANNKSLLAAQSYMESKSLEYKTGNTPSDPFIEADYMIGKPASGGNQFDFLAIQQFDFPTAYKHRADLSEKRTQLLNYGLREIQQEKLLEAKKVCLEIIYFNQYLSVLNTRKVTSTKLLNTYQKKYDAEEITALDLNKAKLQLLGINSKIRELQSSLSILNQKLIELNGGKNISFVRNTYPELDSISDFSVLRDSIVSNESKLNWFEYQSNVLETELDLSKALALPKFEVGYHYQTVLGQTFNGAHFGLSIPLWQQKNTIKTSKSRIVYGVSQKEEYKTELTFNIQELHEQFLNITETINEYEIILGELNSEEILTQSLELGEIDFITYAMELDYFHKAKDDLLFLKKERQLIYAELFKHKL